MTPERFADLLDRFGADMSRWPAKDRQAAATLLTVSGAARDLLAAERLLMEALAAMPADPAGESLRRRVLDIPLEHPRGIAAPSLPERLTTIFAAAWTRWTAGMATASAVMVIGFVLGYGGHLPVPGDTGPEAELAALIAGASDLGGFDLGL